MATSNLMMTIMLTRAMKKKKPGVLNTTASSLTQSFIEGIGLGIGSEVSAGIVKGAGRAISIAKDELKNDDDSADG